MSKHDGTETNPLKYKFIDGVTVEQHQTQRMRKNDGTEAPQRNNNSKMATSTINGAQHSIIILPPQISSIGSGAKVAATKRKTFGEMTRRLMSHCHKRRARSADHATHLRICANT